MFLDPLSPAQELEIVLVLHVAEVSLEHIFLLEGRDLLDGVALLLVLLLDELHEDLVLLRFAVLLQDLHSLVRIAHGRLHFCLHALDANVVLFHIELEDLRLGEVLQEDDKHLLGAGGSCALYGLGTEVEHLLEALLHSLWFVEAKLNKELGPSDLNGSCAHVAKYLLFFLIAFEFVSFISVLEHLKLLDSHDPELEEDLVALPIANDVEELVHQLSLDVPFLHAELVVLQLLQGDLLAEVSHLILIPLVDV